MTPVSLHTRTVFWGRLALLILGSLLILPLCIAVLLLMDSPSDTTEAVVITAAVLGYVALLAVGIPFWALRRVRFEVSDAGVRQELGGGAALRARQVPWGEVREYVLTEYPNGARMLTVRLRAGGKLAIPQGDKAEDRAAFDAFHRAFVAGARRYRPAQAGEEIRAALSFFDGPVARVLAGGAVAMLVALVGLVLFSGRPVGLEDWARLAMIAALLLPLVVRVFRGPARGRAHRRSRAPRAAGDADGGRG